MLLTLLGDDVIPLLLPVNEEIVTYWHEDSLRISTPLSSGHLKKYSKLGVGAGGHQLFAQERRFWGLNALRAFQNEEIGTRRRFGA